MALTGIYSVRILIVGDTHGNTRWLRDYIFPVAMSVEADAIIVCGDYGAWEHNDAGVAFMDAVGKMARDSLTPLYWLHGNHDKHSHTLAHYGTDSRGFYRVRDWLFYIPQGHTWAWEGVKFRVFGGAWSIDKTWRIQAEQENYLKLLRKEQLRQQSTGQSRIVPSQEGTIWFPEEEMTDADMDQLLAADSGRKDVVFSHDKPYSSKPTWNRKDLPGCIPNQLRLDRALRVHQPAWWFHGHLHHYYVDQLNWLGQTTHVVGLDADDNAAEDNWKPRQTWAVLDTAGEGDRVPTVKLGREQFLDTATMNTHAAFMRAVR